MHCQWINITNITNAISTQAEDLLNMIGGENTQNDGASSLKGQNDNNGNSNGDALASVLGFLNQMANEGAKPKVPKKQKNLAEDNSLKNSISQKIATEIQL